MVKGNEYKKSLLLLNIVSLLVFIFTDILYPLQIPFNRKQTHDIGTESF